MRHYSLEQVVRFGIAHPEPKLIADVVVQDTRFGACP